MAQRSCAECTNLVTQQRRCISALLKNRKGEKFGCLGLGRRGPRSYKRSPQLWFSISHDGTEAHHGVLIRFGTSPSLRRLG